MTGLRVAVVGAGYLGRFHAQKFASIAAAELVGICDLRVEAGEGDGILSGRKFAAGEDRGQLTRIVEDADFRRIGGLVEREDDVGRDSVDHGNRIALGEDLLADHIDRLALGKGIFQIAQRTEAVVDSDELLKGAKLRQLRCEFRPLHGIERVLMGQLSHQKLEELRLAEYPSRIRARNARKGGGIACHRSCINHEILNLGKKVH